MRNFLKIFLLTALILLFSGIGSAPQLRAMDPVTIAVLAPVALKAARVATPYIAHAMQCTGAQLVVIGKDIFEIFYLPLGLLQATLGAPFGYFNNGLVNMASGAVAPFKMVLDVLLLPLAIFGIGGSGG